MNDPVWMLFARRSFSRLAYWLAVLGYDLRDRSTSNRIYLVYFCVFWIIWTVAVLILLGGGAASLLGSLQFLQAPPLMVKTLSEGLAIAWVVGMFGLVIHRSPFVFNDEDAFLLCQTPVSRRKVALAWLAQDLIVTLMVSGLIVVILAFALVEWRSPEVVPVARIIDYLRAAVQAIPPVWAVLAGWQAALWGLGSLRLSRRAAFAQPRLIGVLAAVLALAAFIIPSLRPAIVLPFRLPFAAAFAQPAAGALWWGGLAQGILTLTAGSAFFLSQSGGINLSRAAQETRQLALLGQARLFGRQDLIDAILLRQRLSATHAPSRLLVQARGGVLFWKDVLQTLRTARLKDVASLIWIFSLSLAMFGGPTGAALRVVLAGVWAISTGGLLTRRLRSDLARWWLVRSLPVPANSFFAQDFASSWGIVTLLGWLALAFSPAALAFRLGAAFLLPVMAANAGLAAAQDILGHAQARILMSPSLGEENVPRQNITGAILGLVSVLIPFGVLVWFALHAPQPVIAFAAVPLSAAIGWFNLRAARSAYRWIQ